MIDRKENAGAWSELRLLALRRVKHITEEQAEQYASSGSSLFEWINFAPEMADWRARASRPLHRVIRSRIACAWKALTGPEPQEQGAR